MHWNYYCHAMTLYNSRGTPLYYYLIHHTGRESKNFSRGWIGANSSVHTDCLNSYSIRGFRIQSSNCVVPLSCINVSDKPETAKEWEERIGICFKVSYGEALDDMAPCALSFVPFKSNAVLFNFQFRWTAGGWWWSCKIKKMASQMLQKSSRLILGEKKYYLS